MLKSNKSKTLLATLIVISLVAIMFVGIIILDDDSSSDSAASRMSGTVQINTGNTDSQNYDLCSEVSSDHIVNGSLVIKGTYTGTVTFYENLESTPIIAQVSFINVSGVVITCNSADDPYITGNLTSGISTGSMTLSSGSIQIGNDASTFSGIVTSSGGTIAFSDSIGSTVYIGTSGLTISNTTVGTAITTTHGIGFSVVSSISTIVNCAGVDNNSIAINGTVSNLLLGNSLNVTNTSEINLIVLTGTLAYIDRTGGSSVGTLFDALAGNSTATHGILIAYSGEPSNIVTNDQLVDFGGQYLIYISSNTDVITIGGIPLDISGLKLAKSTDTVAPSITGTTDSITMSGTVIIDSFSSSSSVAVFIRSGATISITTDSDISKGNLSFLGSLSVSGVMNLSNAKILTTTGTIATGTIVSDGDLWIPEKFMSSDVDVYSAFYITETITTETTWRFTALSQALSSASSSGGGNVYVIGSCTVSSDMIVSAASKVNIGGNLTTAESTEYLFSGTLYVDKSSLLTISGTLMNMSGSGVIIATGAHIDAYTNGTIDNKGYILVYGILTVNGSDTSTIYADVTSYNSVSKLVKFSSLYNVLSTSVSGESYTLRRATTLNENAVVPAGVKLTISVYALTIADGITLSVSGTIVFNYDSTIVGTLAILTGGEATNTATVTADSGAITVAGTFTNSGIVNVKSLMVTGKLVTTGTVTVVTTGSFDVGTAPVSVPYINNAVVTGTITLDGTAYAVVYGNCAGFSVSNITVNDSDSTMVKTLLYICNDITDDTDKLYATEYGADNTLLVLHNPKLTGISFMGWYTEDKTFIGASSHEIGEYTALYGHTSDLAYNIMLSYTPGITWVIDDSQIYTSGDAIVGYGEHSITVQIAKGYSGTPVLTIDDTEIELGEEFLVDADCVAVVTGITQNEAPSGFSLSLTEILLIVLVIIMIIMVIFILIKTKNKS